MTVDEVMREIEKDQLFYEESQGGVTFSGGEPMTQPLFLIELLKRCGELGLHRTVDTCGQVGSHVLRDVACHTDLFLFDLKHMDSDKHREHTGVGNSRILANLRWLAESEAVIKIRVPLVPGVNDDVENISRTAAFVAALPGHHEIHLLPFHRAAGDKHRRFGMPYQLDEPGESPPERLPLIKRLMEDRGLTVRVGG
jgi:pyruvate formate lyase activating enzyme